MAFTGVGSTSNQSWALFKEQVDYKIIKALQPKIIYPTLCKVYPANGPVVDYNTTDSWLQPGKVSESGEFESGALDYERQYASIKEIGVAPRIPVNWIKDAKWDVVNEHVEAIGFGIARYLNSDVLSSIDTFITGGDVDGRTYTALSSHIVTPTALWSATSSDIVRDIAAGITALSADDAGDGKKYLILHPDAMNYIYIDPLFLKYINSGKNELLDRGIYPTPYGVDILVTTQADPLAALLVNVDLANIKYYERESLVIEIEKSARSKNIDIVASIRYALACGRPKGIVKIAAILE